MEELEGWGKPASLGEVLVGGRGRRGQRNEVALTIISEEQGFHAAIESWE